MTTIKEPFEPVSGVSTQIGYLLSGIEYARGQVREGIKDLTVEQISAQVLPGASSIGQLMIHTAEAEWWWIQCVVGGRPRAEFEKRELYHVTENDNYRSLGHSAEFCISHLDGIGKETLETLKGFGDGDLERFFGWDHRDGNHIEMTLRGILHHLIDHEATHKGQILMLKRLMSEA